jgi:hypothetical protein
MATLAKTSRIGSFVPGTALQSVLHSTGQPDKLRSVDNLPKCWAWKAEPVAELDAGILDHFCPLGRFFLDDRGKLGRRVADRLEAKVVELLAHLRHRQGLDGLLVQSIQNILRRTGRREQAEPRHGLEAREFGFRHGRQVGRQRRALDRGDGQRAHLPFARERHHVHDTGERHADSVGEQVRQ